MLWLIITKGGTALVSRDLTLLSRIGKKLGVAVGPINFKPGDVKYTIYEICAKPKAA